MEYESGGDLSVGGGQFLDEAGTYHLYVLSATESPTKKSGEPIQNSMFGATCEVQAGTTPGQKGKIVNLTFFRGKAGEEKSMAFAKKKMDRFFIATNVLTPGDVENKVKKAIDIPGLKCQQFIAKFDKEKPESKFVDLSFADIYHVDDTAVASIPKDPDMMKNISPKDRWPGGRSLNKDEKPASPPPAAGGVEGY